MDQITSQIKDEVRKRVSHPFLSSFFLALASANYKVFFVLSSDDSYRGKFSYIETVLYPNVSEAILHFAFIPLAAATFFTFAWPLIDAEISSISLMLENRKKLKLLREEKKEPIDKDEQAQYFEKQDKELAELKSRLAVTHDREAKLLKERSLKLSQLTERLKRQALQRMTDFTTLTTEEVGNIFSLDDWNLRDNHKSLLEAAKHIPHIKKLGKVMEAIEKLPLTEDYRKIGNMDWLTSALGESRESAVAFYEILYALNVTGDLIDEDLSFDVNHHDEMQIQKLTSLLKMVSE